MVWLMDDSIRAGAGHSLARMTVAPGVTSEAHRHPNCCETVHVLAGEIEQRCGEEWIKMCTGDTVLIPQGASHQTRNAGVQEAVLMIAYSEGARVYEKL